MIKYSVIIPAYNAKDTIRDCLNSLINQSINKEEYEIIVVDDGSTDGTGQIVSEYPITYIRQSNHGPASARNHGSRNSQGEILLFTDSDCLPVFNWIEEMTNPLKDSNVVAVKGVYRTRQRSLIARFAQLEFEERYELLKKAKYIDMVDTCSAAFRKAVYLQAGGFDESFPLANNEDTDLSYRLSLMGHKMVFSSEAVVYHLRHPDTIWRYVKQKIWRGYWRIMVYKRFPKKAIKDTYTPQTLKIQILLIISLLIFLISSMIWKKALFGVLFLAVFYLISASSFFIFAIKRDRLVGLLSPFFLVIRSLSIGLGVLYSLCRKEIL